MEVCERQQDRLKQIVNDDKKGDLWSTKGELYNFLRGKVSQFALKMILDQEKEAWNAVRDPQGKNFGCTGIFRGQFGLPCWHDILSMLGRESIPLQMVDVHWHLRRGPLPDNLDGLYRIQDPRIIPRRQQDRSGDSHKRDRCRDELPAPPRKKKLSAPPSEQLQPRPSQFNHCSACSQVGHRYNEVKCPFYGSSFGPFGG